MQYDIKVYYVMFVCVYVINMMNSSKYIEYVRSSARALRKYVSVSVNSYKRLYQIVNDKAERVMLSK